MPQRWPPGVITQSAPLGIVGVGNAGKALGEVKICTLSGCWEMVGASTSKQCCAKQRCSLGAADAIGAAAIAIAAAPAAKDAVMASPTMTLPRPQNRTAGQGSPHRWHASKPLPAVIYPFCADGLDCRPRSAAGPLGRDCRGGGRRRGLGERLWLSVPAASHSRWSSDAHSSRCDSRGRRPAWGP